ncbi:MAG: hypothetical protein LT080_02770 [Thiobacillus sp.]|nr:hypothetical protein [Thiobacillus sp.]
MNAMSAPTNFPDALKPNDYKDWRAGTPVAFVIVVVHSPNTQQDGEKHV